jgi:hypothetical protein
MGKDPVSKTKDSARRSMPNSASTHWPTPRITPADLHVQQALDRAALVPDDTGVMADTKDGIIPLAGHVHTWAEYDAVAAPHLMARGDHRHPQRLQVTG